MSEPNSSQGTRFAGWRHVSKRRAFLSHLALSAAIVGSICVLIFVFWYPEPYFTVKGALNVLRVLIAVDLVVGPVLTLVLFRPGKPGLGLDMAMIALIQLSALIYGTTVIYQQRPYYAVFAIDRFEVLAKRDVDATAVNTTTFAEKPLIGPVVAVATIPADPVAAQRLLQETLFEGKPDIERRPEFWHPFDEHRTVVLSRAQSLLELAERHPGSAEDIDQLAASLDGDPGTLLYVPVIGASGPMTVVIDQRSALPIAALPVDPWADTT